MLGSLFEIARREPAGPEAVAKAALAPRPDFQGLEFLAGGVWVAIPWPGTTYSESIEWTLDGQFMTSIQMCCTPPTTASLTNGFLGVEAATQLIVMWGFSNTGSSVNLKQVKPSAPNTWTLEGLLYGLVTRQTMIKVNPQQMKTITETLNLGKWQSSPPVSYVRAS